VKRGEGGTSLRLRGRFRWGFHLRVPVWGKLFEYVRPRSDDERMVLVSVAVDDRGRLVSCLCA
jgi:hypothetical protein